MKEYEIKYEPVKTKEGEVKKWNIYYYIDGEQETKEFWSYTGENEPVEGQAIKQGYKPKT